MRGAEQQLHDAITPVCASLGLELFDVALSDRALQVTVERPGGDELDLDTVAAAARAISAMLDEDESLAPRSRYELEVTSPGLERRLRRPEHFAAVLGEAVALRLGPGAAGPRRVEGTLEVADPTGIVVDLGNGSRRSLGYSEIDRAHLVFDWRAALARDGGGRPRGRTPAPGPSVDRRPARAGREEAR